MVKQAIQTCICGQTMDFPEGEVKAICPCGAVWECRPEGYWYTETPIPNLPLFYRAITYS